MKTAEQLLIEAQIAKEVLDNSKPLTSVDVLIPGPDDKEHYVQVNIGSPGIEVMLRHVLENALRGRIAQLEEEVSNG